MPVLSNAAEVDVWVCDDGKLRLKHDVKGDKGIPPILVEEYLSNSYFEKFFVNIKQSLSTDDYTRILSAFSDRLIGIFDIPSVDKYRLIRANSGCYIYDRMSEIEEPTLPAIWLDSLIQQSWYDYQGFLTRIKHQFGEARVIIACPSLHNRDAAHAEENCWKLIKHMREFKSPVVIEGLVTKYPVEAREVIGD